jgi:hypothetical protein
MNRDIEAEYQKALSTRSELIWNLLKEGYTTNQLSAIFNLPVGNINRIIYTLREIKGSWSK